MRRSKSQVSNDSGIETPSREPASMERDMTVAELTVDGRARAVIEALSPEVDGGRFPAKRVAGEPIRIEADIFTDGHDQLQAVLCWRRRGDSAWRECAMTHFDNDRWFATVTVPEPGEIEYCVAAWVDRFHTWRYDMQKRIEAGQDTEVDYQIGAALVNAATQRAPTQAYASWFADMAGRMRDVALDPLLQSMMARYPDRSLQTKSPVRRIVVDPVLARHGAWYEFFPRSVGTFQECEARLADVAAMGFDIVYFPPIPPIGRTCRKGRNNTLTPEPADVGSPWAIGAEEGGHKSVHPDLGTLEDFRHLVETARGLGLKIALDIAFQASPDHPSAKENQEWFRRRPDGTIQYAENPPKKYQDIYPFDFESDEWRSMWAELKSVFDFWIAQGVTVFRVDNPHTKAFPFWEWCIGEVKREHPEAIFLSEAFTRPKVMYRLAKRVYAVVHVLSVAVRQARDHGILQPDHAASDFRFLPRKPLAEYSRHSH